MAASSAPRPALLCILDGWGWRAGGADNAIAQGHTPNYTRLLAECPHALLQTSGGAVGLPAGQMGNSEVGHMNIGSGRVVAQDLPRIDVAIEDGTLALRPALAGADRQGEEKRPREQERWRASDGPAVAGRRAFASGSHRGLGENPVGGRRAGLCPCLPRRARHAATQCAGFSGKIPARYRRLQRRAPGHPVGPLLRHGPRQALGPGAEML